MIPAQHNLRLGHEGRTPSVAILVVVLGCSSGARPTEPHRDPSRISSPAPPPKPERPRTSPDAGPLPPRSATPAPVASSPRAPPPAIPIRTVVTAPSRACAIARDQTLWCWGQDPTGMEAPSCQSCLTPTRVGLSLPVVDVALSEYHDACALLTDGRVTCKSSRWKTAFHGVSRLAQGEPGCGAILKSERLVTTGYTPTGALGFTASSAHKVGPLREVPVLGQIEDAYIGPLFGCSLDRGGNLSCFGTGFGCDGPHPVEVPGGVRAIRGSGGALCVLTLGGDLYVIHDVQRYLPHGVAAPCDYEGYDVAALFASPLARNVVDASCFGRSGSNDDVGMGCVIRKDKTVACWGGQHRLGPVQAEPGTLVVIPGLSSVREVSASQGFACAITEQDRLLCWGSNRQGQLGRGFASETWERNPAEPALP